MTIEECYRELEGNYKEVKLRLSSDSLIEKFALKFLDSPCYSSLSQEMTNGNREEAFRAAHTLKGVAANLSFTRLFESSSKLTEVLRLESDSISDEAYGLFSEVTEDYKITVDAISSYKASKA